MRLIFLLLAFAAGFLIKSPALAYLYGIVFVFVVALVIEFNGGELK